MLEETRVGENPRSVELLGLTKSGMFQKALKALIQSKHHVSQALHLVRRVLFINLSSGPVTLESATLPWLFSMQHNENHYKL